MQKTRISITLEPEAADMLREYAKSRNRTVSQEVAEMVQNICTAGDGKPEAACQDSSSMASGKNPDGHQKKEKKKKKGKTKGKKRN